MQNYKALRARASRIGRAHTCLFAVLAVLMWSSQALAQSGAGSIQGTVTDSTDAVIPGADIHVVNNSTGVATSAKTNSVGFYQVPGLFTGNYTLTVTAPEMKTYRVGIELQVAQTAIVNATMTAGPVTTQVEVSADVVQLTTTDNGTISSTLESNRINQLPMNGRLLLTLAGQTTPGLESTGQRANGLMPEALEYVADGVPLTNRNFGGEGNSTQAQLPDPDAVQEVRLETTNTSAMYSSPATGIITTKSGTNSLHGSFFETARNNYFGIAKNRNNPANFAAPHLVRNEFGASAGGPIVLPWLYHGKDKSFWFFAYERYSLSNSSNELVSVPTAAMRSGDFSGLVNATGLVQLYDPSTTTYNAACPIPEKTTTEVNPYCRTPFKNNQISPTSISPVASIYYNLLPLPSPSLADVDPLTGSNLNATNPNFTVIPTITWRLDHAFNENNRAYLRYTSNDQTNWALRNYPHNAPSSLAYQGFPVNAAGYQGILISNFGTALGYTHVFSPTFFAETILSQQWFMQYVGAGGNPNLNYEQMLGLPNNFGEAGFPNFSGIMSILSSTQYQYKENQIISNIDENLTKTMGKHQLQFGARYRHERFQYLPDRNQDTIGFDTESTALYQPSTGSNYGGYSNVGYGEADFFLGAASSYSVNLEPPMAHYHDMEFDGYLQDNWRVGKSLTLNLGLRYEAHPAAWTKDGLITGFDMATHSLVVPNSPAWYVSHGFTTQAILNNLAAVGANVETASEAGVPSTLMKNYDFTIGPRVGLAWQPFGNRWGTVLRGAYGRYIYPMPVRNGARNTLSGGPPFSAGYSYSYSDANYTPDGQKNYLIRNPIPTIAGQTSGAQSDVGIVNSSSETAITPGFAGNFLQPNLAPDYVTETNFTVEQPLKADSALRVTWLWTHGTNLDHYYRPNYRNNSSNYVWEMDTGTPKPNGGASVIGTPQQNTYAATALGPYDNTVYGDFVRISKTGWSNDNELQVNYQRLFHHGSAYQITYVWAKAFRVGGNTFRDGVTDTALSYVGVLGTAATMMSAYPVTAPNLPPAVPAGDAPWQEWHGLAVWEQNALDNAIPRHHITFNGIYDFPFGRGKRFLAGSNRLLDELVGGWEVAGSGQVLSQAFFPASGNYGPNNPIKHYKGVKFTDCRSGVCNPAKLWFNGYIAPTAIQGNSCPNSAGSKVVSGLPADYQPYQRPIVTSCTDPNYNTNKVQISAPALNATNKGNPITDTYAPGPYNTNLYSHTVLQGPKNFSADLSMFKVFPITERTNLRFNVDAFNVLNIQGTNNPNTTDGTIQTAPQFSSSYWTPRQVQFTLRFTF